MVVVLGSLFEVGPRGPCCEVRRGQALPRVMTSDCSTLRWLPRLSCLLLVPLDLL